MIGGSPTSSSSESDIAADALTALATLVASGSSVTAAVSQWSAIAPPGCRASIAAIHAGVILDVDIESMHEGLRDPYVPLLWPVVGDARGADKAGGAAAVAILRAGSDSLRRRAREADDAKATTSGARLSGRMVAGLPVAFLLLTPVGGLPSFDLLGVTMLAVGATFVGIGIRWMSRITPGPSGPDLASEAMSQVATLMRAGVPAASALEVVANRTDWPPLVAASRSIRLGSTWGSALAGSHDVHARALARILAAGRRLGTGTAAALKRYSQELEAAERRSFETRLRRAPVLMVVPLVICVLPGFALLTLGPFLRSVLA